MVYLNEKEKERTQAFIREKKNAWDREQDLNATISRNKGEEYQRKESPAISEEDALAAVRLGWMSQLELAFEKKGRKEGWLKNN